MTLEKNTVETNRNDTDGLTRSFHMFATGLTLALLILVAGCNGSDSDGGDATAAPSLTPPGDEGGEQDPTKLQPVSPAEFVSTDAVVMMAPRSLFTTSSAGLAYYQFLSRRTGSPEEPQACDEGRIVVINDELRDVASPYSGALFDVQTTDEQNCIETVELQNSPATVYITEGQRVKGYPAEGVGSDSDQNVFIAYKKFGVSFEDPFREDISEPDADFDITWSRVGDSHVEIKHDPDPAAPYGDASGKSQVSEISLENARSGELQFIRRFQLGDSRTPVNRMQFSFSPFDGQNPDQSRQEEYNGLYGMAFVTINGEPAPDSCTLGRFQVSTLQPLIVQRLSNGESSILNTAGDEPQAGVLQMVDDFGNEATVTYDKDGDAVTVALNNRPSKAYTYEEVEQLFITNCGLEEIVAQ